MANNLASFDQMTSPRMLTAADYANVQPGYAEPGPQNAGPVYDFATNFWNAVKGAPGAGVQHYYDVMGQPNPLTGGNEQWPGEISNFDKLGTLLQTAGTTSLGGVAGGAEAGALGAGASRVIPGMDRLAALASDNAAAARGEYAAGSASRPFASMSGQTVLPEPMGGWHASPYSFDRFDLSKIGTGEGAQAYGHGIYSAESPAVSGPGGQYDRQFTAKNLGQYDLTQQQDSILQALRAGKSDMDILREQASMGADFDQAHAALEQMKAAKAHIYQLAIHADPATLLDWHKPLGQQSQHVQDVVAALGAEHGFTVQPHGAGYLAYQRLRDARSQAIPGPGPAYYTPADAARASQALNEAGIPGLQYRDGLSRTIGTGTLGQQKTSNTVMFDPARIEILRKFGLLGPAAGLGTFDALTQGPQ